MRILKAVLAGLSLSLLLFVQVNPARADTWDKKTKLTFNQPIEIPGKVLLPGTYTFKLYDYHPDRHIVQIWSEDEMKLIATVLAIPNYQLEPKDDTVIKFREMPSGSPQALRAWFYPGDKFGQEFVYPKARAIQLAEESKEIVPATTVEPTESTLKTVPMVAITPEKREEPVTEAIQALPLHGPEHIARVPQAAAREPIAKELPKTASSIPLIAVAGAALIGFAVGLKLLIKQAS